ncbi:MAG: hypothetical protein IJ511_04135 [Bacteroides sp.]|nr:hypothetical protein [Bacteroides sp.]
MMEEQGSITSPLQGFIIPFITATGQQRLHLTGITCYRHRASRATGIAQRMLQAQAIACYTLQASPAVRTVGKPYAQEIASGG